MFLQKYDNVEEINLNEELWSKIDISMVQGNKDITLYDKPRVITYSDLVSNDDYYYGMTLYIDGVGKELVVFAKSYETAVGDNLFNMMFNKNRNVLKELIGDEVGIVYGVPISEKGKLCSNIQEEFCFAEGKYNG